MQGKFKVGDRVRVVEVTDADEGTGLKVGNVYTITEECDDFPLIDFFCGEEFANQFPDGYMMQARELELVEAVEEAEVTGERLTVGDWVEHTGEDNTIDGGRREFDGPCQVDRDDKSNMPYYVDCWWYTPNQLRKVDAPQKAVPQPEAKADVDTIDVEGWVQGEAQPQPILTVLPAGSVACYPGTCADCEHFKARLVGADCLATILEEGLL